MLPRTYPISHTHMWKNHKEFMAKMCFGTERAQTYTCLQHFKPNWLFPESCGSVDKVAQFQEKACPLCF